MMHEAIREANTALEEHEVPIGAVLVCDGKIIVKDHNRKEALQDPSAHAEMLVIRRAAQILGRWRLGDCTLYVTAEPCPMCMGAIIQARIRRLVYGTCEKHFGAVETTANLGQHAMLPTDFEVYAGICEDKCAAILKTFFETKR